MKSRGGFTMMEIIAVLFVVGILVAMMLPNLINTIEQTNAQTAMNNLMAIEAAQSKFNDDYTTACANSLVKSCYCYSSSSSPLPTNCGSSKTSLNTNLSLTMSADNFTYTCIESASGSPILSATGTSYSCTAVDNTDTLTLIPANNPPITCTPANTCPTTLL